jgi:hypothetical protein
MRRYCSLFVAAILLSGCGNFIGTMGERIGGISAEPTDQKQGKSSKKGADSK